jgi:hypothetical protein
MKAKGLEVLDGCGGRYKVILEKKFSGDGLAGRVLSAEHRNPPWIKISVALGSGRGIVGTEEKALTIITTEVHQFGRPPGVAP